MSSKPLKKGTLLDFFKRTPQKKKKNKASSTPSTVDSNESSTRKRPKQQEEAEDDSVKEEQQEVVHTKKTTKKRRVIHEEDDESEDEATEQQKKKAATSKSKASAQKASSKMPAAASKSTVDKEASSNEPPKKKAATNKAKKASSMESKMPAKSTTAKPKSAAKIPTNDKKKPAANAWGSLQRFTSSTMKKSRKALDAPSSSSNRTVKLAYTKGDHLPILSSPQDCFDDMVGNLTRRHCNSLHALLQKLSGRPLRVATMCSGTESPILALNMLTKSIQDYCHAHQEKFGDLAMDSLFPVQHVFSCEIEPFKQAYIQRNFQPPLLFRDIRELGNDQAHTAFGSLENVPCEDVDLLIAGTSCVDYSNLNNEQKSITQSGESGQTWRGMIEWIQKARPPICIFENVCQAPWDKMRADFETLGYHATHSLVDTKDYYIPQTRNRGYMFVIRKDTPLRKSVANKWIEMVKQLERPASAALDAFMLPHDDPRVLRGRARLVKTESSNENQVEWTKCEARHQFARANEELGDKRPLTGWSESGNTSMPAYAWNDWCNGQLNRVHDLLDISVLRCAQDDIDSTYKTMVWNLSQNVDRDTIGKLGVSQCLTPSGMPYVTNRGGPLVGEELLLLQGIPADDLNLTRETDKQMKDLAGNAMSTTVVGACMLSALILGHEALESRKADGEQEVLPFLVPRPLAPASSGVVISRSMANYNESTLRLGPRQDCGEEFYRQLLQESAASARVCITEGIDEALPADALVQCQACGIVTSAENNSPPRKFEEHEFVPMQDSERMDPATFRSKLLDALPMCLELHSFDLDATEESTDIDGKLWSGWRKAFDEAAASTTEYRFTRLIRSHAWTVVYRSPNDSRLELTLSKSGAVWRLFATAPPEKGRLRDALCRPVARMHVTDWSNGFLSGKWELCLPKIIPLTVTIEGAGSTTNSWKSKLGLKGEFESEIRYETLNISINDADGVPAGLKAMVDGEYKLLPKCGATCGSLHKRVQKDESGEMFFFLESGRCTLGEDDTFVFSRDMRRKQYTEYRDVVLRIDPKAKYRTDFHEDNTTKSHQVVSALAPGKWIDLNGASLRSIANRADTKFSTPSDSIQLSLSSNSWNSCPEVLSCELPLDASDKLHAECARLCSMAGEPTIEVNISKSRKVFDDLAFATTRLEIPSATSRGWLSIESSAIDRVDGEELACTACAPTKPRVKWTLVSKGKRILHRPIEDGKEAAVYEKSMKHRPNPWLVTLRPEKSALQLRIACNAVSLVHRALGLFPRGTPPRRAMINHAKSGNEASASSDCIFEWRIVPHADKTSSDSEFPELALMSNKKDRPAAQPPGFESRYPLRPEQLRSLKWMLAQEASSTPFLEEEVTEAVLPNLNWRAEGRAVRPVLVRGGIIADEVGYGKTAISLGCLAAAPHVNGDPPETPIELRDQTIPTAATLVVVPSHLVGQWANEIKKFLGDDKRVVCIKDMGSLNKITIETIQTTDIVVVSFQVLSGEKYFERLARFGGVKASNLPKGGRHFDDMYKECLHGVGKRVSEVKNDCSSAFAGIEKDAEEDEADCHVRLDGKKAVYKNLSEEQVKASGPTEAEKPKTAKGKAKKKSDKDPWGLSKISDFKKMQCPPLECFFYRRVVVDEFTYLADKTDRARVLSLVLGLKSSFRWFLSGTPAHETFKDVQVLAKLLGIHLGVDDVLPSESLKKRRGDAKDETEMEKFSSLLETRSLQWHERRHNVAQEFLSRFVRQNIAEIDEIPCEESIVNVDLPPAEMAIYFELENYLKALEWNARKALKSKKSSRGDRENRMQRILQESGSAEEALLKRCAHFNMSATSATALETCNAIIATREQEKADCEAELLESIAAAFRQRNRILSHQPRWVGTGVKNSNLEKGEVQDRLELFVVDAAKKNSIAGGADDEIHEKILEILQLAQDDVAKNPSKTDSFFELNDDDDSTSTGKRKRSSSVDAEQLHKMKFALREHMHKVRSLAKELRGRIHSSRFFEWVRKFQLDETEIKCMGHDSTRCACHASDSVPKGEMGVLSSCGHVGCLSCLRFHANSEVCIDPTCQIPAKLTNITSAAGLGADKDHSSTGGQYGAKLCAIVKHVKGLVHGNDRIIVFCQFQDLKDKVEKALNDSGVKSIQVKGTVQQQMKAVDVMQKETPSKDDPRVLLLTMDNESSAGVNLTTCNHAVFVHPLLADSQQQYDAYETQAIGRIRRYGQTKKVHIWRFIARDTIDERIYESRRNGGRRK